MFIKAERYLGFDDKWLIAIGIPIVSLVVTIMIFGTNTFMTSIKYCYFIAILHTLVYWFSFSKISN